MKWVERDTLEANDYNPNHVAPLEKKLLKLSLLRQGWTQPIVVLNDGRTIVDGFHRWSLAAEPEIAKLTGGRVPVVMIDAGIHQRRAATIRHNRARGQHGIDPMAAIVSDLLKSGMKKDEIMDELGMQEEEVDRLDDHRGQPERVGGGTKHSKGWVPKVGA